MSDASCSIRVKDQTAVPGARTLPFDRVTGLLDRVRETDARHGSRGAMALCVAHRDNGPSLSVREAADGKVLLRCFAGCSFNAIVSALGLQPADLFPTRDPKEEQGRAVERADLQRRYRSTPSVVIREMTEREIERKRDALLERDGYVRPLRSDDLNDVRRRVARVLGIAEPKALPPFVWEQWPPHDVDPEWPSLFERGLKWAREEAREQGVLEVVSERALHFRAAKLATGWLREMSGYKAPPLSPKLAPFLIPMCLGCGYCHRPGTPHPYEREQAETRAAMARLRAEVAARDGAS